MDEEDLEDRLAAALDAEVSVSRDRDERAHDGPVRFTVYCEEEATDHVREQLSDAGTEISFETGR